MNIDGINAIIAMISNIIPNDIPNFNRINTTIKGLKTPPSRRPGNDVKFELVPSVFIGYNSLIHTS